ncbi:MAG: 50S ribosomal protein L21 [Parachlamydiaceae bacterium]|nr:50S ribosomal protein L21 [Parachlamydiaceae bacterium]
MYAIIKTGGKQYRVAVGDILDVELLNDAENGAQVEFGEVLFAFDGSKTQIGTPSVKNLPVFADVIGTVSGEKVTCLKYKPSHNQCRKWGHRQKYTRVKITGIGKNEAEHKQKGKEARHGA